MHNTVVNKFTNKLLQVSAKTKIVYCKKPEIVYCEKFLQKWNAFLNSSVFLCSDKSWLEEACAEEVKGIGLILDLYISL